MSLQGEGHAARHQVGIDVSNIACPALLGCLRGTRGWIPAAPCKGCCQEALQAEPSTTHFTISLKSQVRPHHSKTCLPGLQK